MSQAFPQKHVEESTEIIIKDRVAEKSGPRVTENMASLRLNINLKYVASVEQSQSISNRCFMILCDLFSAVASPKQCQQFFWKVIMTQAFHKAVQYS